MSEAKDEAVTRDLARAIRGEGGKPTPFSEAVELLGRALRAAEQRGERAGLAAVRKYGQHLERCINLRVPGGCDCGLWEAADVRSLAVPTPEAPRGQEEGK